LSSRLLTENFRIKIYKTLILPVALHGCETQFLILREERTLSVFGNRVLRKMFGPKREEVAGGWRRQLHNLYVSLNINWMIKSRKMRWTEHVARMGDMRNEYKIFVVEPERKRPYRRPERRWEGSITMDLREIGWVGVDWIHVAQDGDRWRDLVNTVINFQVP